MNLLLILIVSVGAMAAPSESSLNDFFKDKTKIQNPLDLRDPFKSPNQKSNKQARDNRNYTVSGKGVYTNIGDSSLSDLNVQELRLMGVMIGRERRAMIQGLGQNKPIIVVKEGSKIGPDNAEVKAILPGGIVLVERIINVYGQEEYLETVIPISR